VQRRLAGVALDVKDRCMSLCGIILPNRIPLAQLTSWHCPFSALVLGVSIYTTAMGERDGENCGVGWSELGI
jgi:hypothetical protein